MKVLGRFKGSREAKPEVPNGDPYADARHAWNERYGTYIQQAYNWRLLALLEAVGLIVAIAGLIAIATQTRLVPYVVAIDKIGTAIAVQPADRASAIDPRVVRAQLANWIVLARSVVTDRIVELGNLHDLYLLVAPQSSAQGYLDSWYPADGHSPFDRAKTETDTVTVNAIVPISPSSYEMQWTETIRDLHGKVTGTETWEATAQIAFRPPADEATILKNPLGLYITSINWTKKI
ncbi:MAG TPA: VirB8/TrbF family protein [Candidatus Limnocylindria bacterium]|jgi:type IV secretory pathway TrbF-like protein|nr:VirB8/TrbF family protein [Candidatus Limnocylindria bacterium]